MENKTREGAACEDVQAEVLHPVKLSWHLPKWRNEHELLTLQLLFHSDIPFISSEMSLCFQDLQKWVQANTNLCLCGVRFASLLVLLVLAFRLCVIPSLNSFKM